MSQHQQHQLMIYGKHFFMKYDLFFDGFSLAQLIRRQAPCSPEPTRALNAEKQIKLCEAASSSILLTPVSEGIKLSQQGRVIA